MTSSQCLFWSVLEVTTSPWGVVTVASLIIQPLSTYIVMRSNWCIGHGVLVILTIAVGQLLVATHCSYCVFHTHRLHSFV